jgi:hypothetical protein
MKKPNLVNPNFWTPFRSIPIANDFSASVPVVSIPEVETHFSRPISRRELVQRNSFYLNLFCLIIILGISYFLYSVYLERKIFSDYIENEHYL